MRYLLLAAVAAIALSGCDDDEEEPAPDDPREAVRAVERAAQRFLDAGPSELTITVAADPFAERYELRETVDPNSGWFLSAPPRPAPGVSFRSRSRITGHAFSFGHSDVDRAYVRAVQGCWIEAHEPAGSLRAGLSAEEALVMTHTVLALLTRNARNVSEPTLDLGELGRFFTDRPRTFSLRLAPPSFEDASNLTTPPGALVDDRYLRERQRSGRRGVRGIGGELTLGIKDGLPNVLVIPVAGGRSTLDFIPRRPDSTVVVTFDAIGEGEPVGVPKCRGIE